MKLQYLPLGLQSFKSIREGNFLYVDKTKYICDVAESGKYYFLSRPRRFGKSLTLHTFKELFLNRKDLFTGLYAEDNWEWGTEYPIFHIQFNELGYDEVGLEKVLHAEINNHAQQYSVELTSADIPARFRELIQKLHAKYNKVVVLIDEYDKPMIDYLTKDVIHKAKENRDILRSFYGILKAADEHLRFVFITGISKFAQTGIFSQLNNLTDLTMSYDHAAMCGYTQEELTHYFTPYLRHRLDRLELTEEEAWSEVKKWYDGYTWNLKDYVYNPFSLSHFMNEGVFKNFWFLSGAPKFLVDLLKEKEIYQVEMKEITPTSLDSYDLETLSPLVLMFQTGYLTLKSKERSGLVKVGYPNREVEEAMYNNLLIGYATMDQVDGYPSAWKLSEALRTNDAAQIVKAINTLFASMPYDLVFTKTEKYFQAIIYLAFKLMGQYIQNEVRTSDGRMDAVVHTADSIWILEFKLDQTAEEALDQIDRKAYADVYKSSEKALYALGINFSSVTKKVDGFRELRIF